VTSRAAFPLFSRLQHDGPALQRAFGNVTKASLIFAAGLFGALLLFSPEVIRIAFGDRWLASSTAMQVLCLAGLATNVLNTNRTLLRACGMAHAEFSSYFAQATLSVIAFYVAAQRSIEAVALAFVVVQLAVMAPLLMLSMRTLGIRLLEYLRFFMAPMVAFLVAALLVTGVAAFQIKAELMHALQALTFCFAYFSVSCALLKGDLRSWRSQVSLPSSPY
jgi:O-antigen/teichoic acid export membrane protein